MVKQPNKYIGSLREEAAKVNDMLARCKTLVAERTNVLHQATSHLRPMVKRAQMTELSVSSIYNCFVESLPDNSLAVVAVGPNGECLHTNETAQKLFSGDDLTGQAYDRKDSSFFLADKLTPCDQNMPWLEACQGREIISSQLFYKKPNVVDGLWLSCDALPIRNESDIVSGAIAIFINVTEFLELEQLVTGQKHELEQRILATTAAHQDLKTLASKLGTHFNWQDLSRSHKPVISSNLREKAKRALVVDDIIVNQVLMRSQLVKLGSKVEIAQNGKEAVELASKSHYDLILMDCDMPVMDGYEATREIRKLEAGGAPKSTIVAMTAFNRLGDREKCLAAGMDHYLCKGGSQSGFLKTVENILNGTADADQAAPVESESYKQSEEAGLNWQSLENSFGSKAVDEIVPLYLRTTAILMDCLDAAIFQRDVWATHHYAYCVKGPTSSIGKVEMAQLCQKIAESALRGKWFDADFEFSTLNSAYRALRNKIDTDKGGNQEKSGQLSTANAGYLNKLLNSLGKQITLELLEAFLEDTKRSVEDINNWLATQQMDKLRACTHKIAGCSASIMDEKTEKLSIQIQELARQNNWIELPQLKKELIDSLNQTRTMAETFLKESKVKNRG